MTLTWLCICYICVPRWMCVYKYGCQYNWNKSNKIRSRIEKIHFHLRFCLINRKWEWRRKGWRERERRRAPPRMNCIVHECRRPERHDVILHLFFNVIWTQVAPNRKHWRGKRGVEKWFNVRLACLWPRFSYKHLFYWFAIRACVFLILSIEDVNMIIFVAIETIVVQLISILRINSQECSIWVVCYDEMLGQVVYLTLSQWLKWKSNWFLIYRSCGGKWDNKIHHFF